MSVYARWFGPTFQRALKRPFVQVVFGARQTGKTTLIRSLLPKGAVHYDLAEPGLRARLMAEPGMLKAEITALPRGTTVSIDEAQLVPSVFDTVQHLYDADKRAWRFVLCGSSARKLRSTGANLLPGRSQLHRMFPLMLAERGPFPPRATPGPLPIAAAAGVGTRQGHFDDTDLMTRLAYGELPGVAVAAERDRTDLLTSYATIYLEEEVRREAMVRNWGAFLRFLRLAAAESGHEINHSAIARDAGVTMPTVKAHYQLLEDMFVGFHVPAWSRSPRRNLLSTPRFYFFDVGVRHAAAGLRPTRDLVLADPGRVFEQWVGIELYKRLQYLRSGTLHHLRSKDGAEVDFIVEHGGRLSPVEVKWTERPRIQDARHLVRFMDEQGDRAPRGWIVCRCERPMRLSDRITAVPWWALGRSARSASET